MLAHCKFCDFQIIADREFKTEEEAAEYATMHCDCGDAVQYRADKEREELREKNVRRIEGAIESVRGFCRKRGVFFVEDTTEVLRSGAMCVLDEFIDAINIKISQIKIVIQKNSKGVLIFKKNYSETNQEEVV